jgi:hypothetical protein
MSEREGLVLRFWDTLLADVQAHEVSGPLREVAHGRKLEAWTRLMTEAVVRSCGRLGWRAAARRHRQAPLPQAQGEYLALDVMAFAEPATIRWPFPVGAFELENSRDEDRVAYSLWKVLCVRAPLRVVFAYRRDWTEASTLVQALQRDVIAPLPSDRRAEPDHEVALIIGSRGQGETFPWGYFRLWRLDAGVGVFERVLA